MLSSTLRNVRSRSGIRHIKMKGSETIIDPYYPNNWLDTYKKGGTAELKTKVKKTFKKYTGLSIMKWYAGNAYKNIHSDTKAKYVELYKGIGSKNKHQIAAICSPKFTTEMTKRITPGCKTDIHFNSLTTSIENIAFMVPKMPGMNMLTSGAANESGYDYLFQVTMRIKANIDANVEGRPKASLKNEPLDEVVIVEMAKANNEQHPWRLCGIVHPKAIATGVK